MSSETTCRVKRQNAAIARFQDTCGSTRLSRQCLFFSFLFSPLCRPPLSLSLSLSLLFSPHPFLLFSSSLPTGKPVPFYLFPPRHITSTRALSRISTTDSATDNEFSSVCYAHAYSIFFFFSFLLSSNFSELFERVQSFFIFEGRQSEKFFRRR